MNTKRLILPLLIMGSLSACGGSSRNHADVQLPETVVSYANQCSPDNPFARDANGYWLSGYSAGSRLAEQRFAQGYLESQYLWYDEMQSPNPAAAAFSQTDYETGMRNYFRALLTPKLTASGQRKDRFSFVTSTAEWNRASQTGVVRGYGADFAVISAEVPRVVQVAYVLAGTTAARQGLKRGDRLLGIIGQSGRMIDVVNTTDAAEIAELNSRLFNATDGDQLSMYFDRGGTVVAANLTAANHQASAVHTNRVIITPEGDKVGYILFNRFVLPLESALRNVITQLQQAEVKDVVVDLRYNGGGYLYQSAQLAYMLADREHTSGQVFERLMYNAKRSADTNSAASVMGFQSTTSGYSGTGTAGGSTLPNLGLKRVYVLTGGDTCSASESLINGLRGVDVEVIQIGSTTCGKPYGFRAHDNCGMSYFPIEFVGVNAKGVNDFVDGFVPNCAVADDFSHELGDENEALLSAALQHRLTGACPATATKSLDAGASAGLQKASTPLLRRDPLHTNKFLMP